MLKVKKGKIKALLAKLPQWLFSDITFAAILYLTLFPHPLGDETPQLFEGADKVVHAVMFGWLAAMGLLDIQRKNGWKPTEWWIAAAVAAMASLFGAFIEFLQMKMGLGRGFEWGDIIADTAGAFLFSALWLLLNRKWSAE